MKYIKTKFITKMLTLLGFSSVAFVFTACYGTVPYDFDEEYQDSLSVSFSQTVVDSTTLSMLPASSNR